jgi:hypothetical protein
VIVPNAESELQQRLFQGAIEQLVLSGEPLNRVLEVNVEVEELQERIELSEDGDSSRPRAEAHSPCPSLFSRAARYVLLRRVWLPSFRTRSNSPWEAGSSRTMLSMLTTVERCT